MKRTLLALACVAAVGLLASNADAQCSFNTPAKAKGLKADMARVFAGCGNSITYGAPNSVSDALLPTCAPVSANSTFQFGEKGACSVKTTQKLESPCSIASHNGPDCANIFIQLKCKDIRETDGITLVDGGPDWTLATLARATFNDVSNGDMTLIDFPVPFVLSPEKGGIKFKQDLNSRLDALGLAKLPGCATVQLINIQVADPTGALFASMGSATAP